MNAASPAEPAFHLSLDVRAMLTKHTLDIVLHSNLPSEGEPKMSFGLVEIAAYSPYVLHGRNQLA